MKEATAAGGTSIPTSFNKRAANCSKSPKQTTCLETENTSKNKDKSPPKKRKPPSKQTTVESDIFQVAASGASRDVSGMLSKFAQVLSERAAAETAQMKELEGILGEARNLETYLKEKKHHLRKTLNLISDKLMG